jgi:uncharacterized protein (DUF2384 family)
VAHGRTVGETLSVEKQILRKSIKPYRTFTCRRRTSISLSDDGGERLHRPVVFLDGESFMLEVLAQLAA